MVHARIEINPEVLFGKPVIRNTRVRVDLILCKLAGDITVDDIVADHPNLIADAVHAATAFAADHAK